MIHHLRYVICWYDSIIYTYVHCFQATNIRCLHVTLNVSKLHPWKEKPSAFFRRYWSWGPKTETKVGMRSWSKTPNFSFSGPRQLVGDWLPKSLGSCLATTIGSVASKNINNHLQSNHSVPKKTIRSEGCRFPWHTLSLWTNACFRLLYHKLSKLLLGDLAIPIFVCHAYTLLCQDFGHI